MATDLEQTQKELKVLSRTDALTGLSNRRVFEDRLEHEIERARRYGRPMSILLLDIDRFKRVNDDHGHPAGDQVLSEFAEVVRAALRPIDLLARYGGEEFTVVLPETDTAGAAAAAERIRGSVAHHTMKTGPASGVTITVSIGMATFPDDGQTTNDLISRVDHALYLAKANGRNRVCRCETIAADRCSSSKD